MKNIYTIIIFMLFVSVANGQKIDPTLEVRRDFDVQLAEINKSKLNTSFPDSLSRFEIDFDYYTFDKPLGNLYEFLPLPSANIEKETALYRPWLSVKAGAGLIYNPFANIRFQPKLPSKVSLLIYGDHDSWFGKVPVQSYDNEFILRKSGEKTFSPYSINKIGAKIGFNWEKGVLGFETDYDNRLSSFYGFEPKRISSDYLAGSYTKDMTNGYIKDSLSRRSGVAVARFFLESMNPDNNSFHYKADLSYTFLKDKSILSDISRNDMQRPETEEQIIRAVAAIGYGFADHSRIMLSGKYETSDHVFRGIKTTNSNLEIYPYYIFRSNGWTFRLGLKYAEWEMSEGKDFNIYLNGLASYELYKKRLWFYASIDGANNFTTYRELLSANSWVSPLSTIDNIEQPLIIRTGFKGNIKDLISYHIYGGYEEFNNQLYFIKQEFPYSLSIRPVNNFHTIYGDESRFVLGSELFFKSKDVEGGVRLKVITLNRKTSSDIPDRYNHFNTSPLELRSFVRYNWRERIVVSADFLYRYKTPVLFFIDDAYPSGEIDLMTYGGCIPSFAVLDIEITRVFSDHLSLFLKGSNIFNSTVAYLPYYTLPGIQMKIGVNIKF